MREIIFRAKTLPNQKDVKTGKIIKKSKWVYGYIDLGYMHDCKVPLISDEKGNNCYKCYYETIGQYTGLTDKNGKKIFEGDIVKRFWLGSEIIYCIKYEEENAHFIGEALNESGFTTFDCDGNEFEIIANIYDNPELIKQEG